MDEKEAEARLQTELERLRAEGARRRMEKEEELRKQMEEPTPVAEEPAIPAFNDIDCTLKIKWKRKKHNLEAAELKDIFSAFGPVDSVAISAKKQGRALVVFKNVVAAHIALTNKGTNPRLDPFDSIDWVGESEPAIVKKMNAMAVAASFRSDDAADDTASAAKMTAFAAAAVPSSSLFAAAPSGVSAFGSVPSFAPPSFRSAPAATDDYGTMTPVKMRQVEREKLEKEVQEKEAAEAVPQG